MLRVKESQQFRRDVKTCLKRHKDMGRLAAVLDILRIPEDLPPKNRDHIMVGDYIGYRECHIEPD